MARALLRGLLHTVSSASVLAGLACSGTDDTPSGGTAGSGGDGPGPLTPGGAPGTGGDGLGPLTTGGSPGSGGDGPGQLATGGSSGAPATGGSGNSASGGSGGDGSAGEGSPDAGPGAGGSSSSGSLGCGSTDGPSSGTFTIDVNGTPREYILEIPADYDPSHAYPVFFGWHWRYADAGQVANGEGASPGPYYGLEALAGGSMIFVAPEGLAIDGVTGWANQNGSDIAFTEAMLDHLESELCIDTDRIFSAGFSFGGMFSYAIGCALADRFRAIAPMSGALWSGCEDGTQPIAMWGAHGITDSIVTIDNGRAARDEFIERNGCSTTSTPTEPSGCVSYDDCEAGYPLVWCEYNDGHWPPAFAPQAMWNFFSQF